MKQIILALIVITNIYEDLDYDSINVYDYNVEIISEATTICKEYNYIIGDYVEIDC